jgi:hypothetical protein
LDRADDTGHFRNDGHASVRGWATALTAEHAAGDLASDRVGDPMSRLARTDAQRRMDALHRLVMRGDERPPATGDEVDHERCETTTGITISPRDAVIASMLGHVRRVVVDSSGRVIDLGRRRRFTGAARDAVLLDGRRCLWPGCGRPTAANSPDPPRECALGRTLVWRAPRTAPV